MEQGLQISIAVSSVIIIALLASFLLCSFLHQKLPAATRAPPPESAPRISRRRAALSQPIPPPAAPRANAGPPACHRESCLKSDAETACPICLEPLSVRTKLAAGPCQHWLHEDCLQNWLRRDAARLCPICRLPVAVSVAQYPKLAQASERDVVLQTEALPVEGVDAESGDRPGSEAQVAPRSGDEEEQGSSIELEPGRIISPGQDEVQSQHRSRMEDTSVFQVQHQREDGLLTSSAFPMTTAPGPRSVQT